MCAGHLTPAFLRTRALKPRVRVVLSAGHIDLMRKVAFHVNILIDFCVQRNVTPCPGNAVPVLQALSLSVALVVLLAGLVGFVSWEDASPGSRGPGQGAGSVRRGGRPGAAAARALPRGRPPPRPLRAGGVLATCSLHTGASPTLRAPACAPTTGAVAAFPGLSRSRQLSSRVLPALSCPLLTSAARQKSKSMKKNWCTAAPWRLPSWSPAPDAESWEDPGSWGFPRVSDWASELPSPRLGRTGWASEGRRRSRAALPCAEFGACRFAEEGNGGPR